MCWRRCRKLRCKTVVLVIKSFHLRRFPIEYRLSSDHRLRLASHCRTAAVPADLGTGSRQTPTPDNPSRSSSQSVSTPLESEHRTSSGKRIVSIPVETHQRTTGCFAPHQVPTPLTRRTSSSTRRRSATGCRLHLLSMGDEITTLFKYPSVGSTRTG